MTPTDWFSKRQVTGETGTYGSEFVAAKTATEQIMDLTNILRYVGVPIMNKAYMFGDNKSVVTSSVELWVISVVEIGCAIQSSKEV